MVVMNPRSTPKASSSTLIIGTKQFVVHEALDTTKCFAESKVSSFTPMTKVASASLHGAETRTLGAPASRWAAPWSLVVKWPDDSIMTSTPSDFHGSSDGSRYPRTGMVAEPT